MSADLSEAPGIPPFGVPVIGYSGMQSLDNSGTSTSLGKKWCPWSASPPWSEVRAGLSVLILGRKSVYFVGVEVVRECPVFPSSFCSFRFLPKQVPGSVVPMALAAAVFQTGKSVHFLLHACEDKAVASQLAGEAADSALREHRESRQGEYDADMAAWEWPPSDVKALAKVQARVSSQVEGRLLMVHF